MRHFKLFIIATIILVIKNNIIINEAPEGYKINRNISFIRPNYGDTYLGDIINGTITPYQITNWTKYLEFSKTVNESHFVLLDTTEYNFYESISVLNTNYTIVVYNSTDRLYELILRRFKPEFVKPKSVVLFVSVNDVLELLEYFQQNPQGSIDSQIQFQKKQSKGLVPQVRILLWLLWTPFSDSIQFIGNASQYEELLNQVELKVEYMSWAYFTPRSPDSCLVNTIGESFYCMKTTSNDTNTGKEILEEQVFQACLSIYNPIIFFQYVKMFGQICSYDKKFKSCQDKILKDFNITLNLQCDYQPFKLLGVLNIPFLDEQKNDFCDHEIISKQVGIIVNGETVPGDATIDKLKKAICDTMETDSKLCQEKSDNPPQPTPENQPENEGQNGGSSNNDPIPTPQDPPTTKEDQSPLIYWTIGAVVGFILLTLAMYICKYFKKQQLQSRIEVQETQENLIDSETKAVIDETK